MPFTKQSNGKYTSPSGRVFTGKQIALYYATNGFKDKPKKRIFKGGKKKTA